MFSLFLSLILFFSFFNLKTSLCYSVYCKQNFLLLLLVFVCIYFNYLPVVFCYASYVVILVLTDLCPLT